MSELSQSEIQNFVRQRFEQALEEDEAMRANRKPLGEEELMYEWNLNASFLAETKEQLSKSDYHNVSKQVEWLLADNGLDVNRESVSFKRLCRELLKVEVKILEIAKRRDLGDYEYEETVFQQAPQFSPAVDNGPTETITEVIKHYVSESEANWTPKTKAEIVNDSLALLIDVVGDVPLQAVDRRKMNEFKQTLRKLPPNRNKSKQYRDKSIPQLVRMNVKKTLSERTINKHLTRIGTLFDYAITNGFYDGPNPALKMSLKLNQSDEESRAAYTPDELERLFHSEKYLEDTHTQPYQFWTPVIALFTGMRQNEIAQLYLDDIREEEGVWYFDLNKEFDKRLKNKNAKRKVPIHRFLLDELRLLDYVNHLRTKGEVRLFPEIKPDRDGYGGPVSKWFNERYKTKCGIKSGERQKDFHSFRATFITALEPKAPYRMLQQCVGHSRGKSTTVTYIETYNPKQLYDEVVSKLDYSIALGHLKESKYVP